MSANFGYSQFDAQQLANDQKRQQEEQRGGKAYQNVNPADRKQQLDAAADEERQKNMMTQMLMMQAQGMAGRGVPAYDQNMANGRQGLVDPALTQQQQIRPMPWDERFASTANLMGIQNSTQLYAPSEQITSQVAQLTPMQQLAVKPNSTIYQQTSSNWVENRLNLALQRNRENSVYAIK